MARPRAKTLSEAAVAILESAAPEEKIRLTRLAAADWRLGRLRDFGDSRPPDRPARPLRPPLRPPSQMPKRRLGGRGGRIALIHALAHIELNAIDLAWDIIARFGGGDLPRAFYDDWIKVASDEASHHALLEERLRALGAAYGELPAHDGLWEAAADTAHDLLARLAIVPLVLEARAIDVTPGMAERLREAGDKETAAILETIYQDEISHVGIGRHWFDYVCTTRAVDPVETWQNLVKAHFKGKIKPPFNDQGRELAGFGPDYYLPIAVGVEDGLDGD
jgi:uncharacterized ferritin-like protein (DUF455 family)